MQYESSGKSLSRAAVTDDLDGISEPGWPKGRPRTVAHIIAGTSGHPDNTALHARTAPLLRWAATGGVALAARARPRND